MLTTARCVVFLLVMGLVSSAALAQTQVIPPLKRVEFVATPAEQCFIWWAAATGQHLVINWDRLKAQGYDRSLPVTMTLTNVRATTALRLLMSECFADGNVLAEVKPQYTRIMTRQQANENPVVRVYSVGDLLAEVPDFDNAPRLSLEDIAADAGAGNSGFLQALDAQEQRPTRAQRLEQFMDSIRNHIEPTIWRANGGLYGSMSYLNGSLIVRAPEYVQRQIGLPAVTATPRPVAQPAVAINPRHRAVRRDSNPTRSNGVSGITPTALGNDRPWR